MVCPYCKAENRDGVHYCASCGKVMELTATVVDRTGPTEVTPVSVAGQDAGATGPGDGRAITVDTRLQGGRYVIKKVLGQGAMGAALLATDLRLDGKSVVIKELMSDTPDPAQLQENVRNFKREVAMLAHIDHALVPDVTDHFQEGSRYFMVQEYVDGENLEERMVRLNQPMRERDALGYAWEVLDILDYLSQQTPPIVHRDIKPANIVIGTKDKRPHLVDFGIAREDAVRNAQQKQTAGLGTPGYAPPEQYQGNADPRSDLYALGATLHYLLTNRDPRNHPPFVYPPVRALNPQLSPEVERVLMRALTNEINQRYQSAAAMKQDIYEILLNRFGLMGNVGNDILDASAPIPAMDMTGATTIANPPTQIQQPLTPLPPVTPVPAAAFAPIDAFSPLPPVGTRFIASQPIPAQPAPFPPANPFGPPSQQPQQRGKSHMLRNVLLILLVIVVLAGLGSAAYFGYFRNHGVGQGSNSGPGSTETGTPSLLLPNGIGVAKAPDGEYIGISDGTFAFDVSRPDGNAKRQAADRLKADDVAGAQSLWQSGLQQDTSDAEALIYLEDQRVLASGNPHVTFVVGTIISGDNVGVGHDDLQGAYVAQKEFNDSFRLPNSVQVRLLIANAGNVPTYATMVAQQIVQAAQHDKTIVGVMGWPFSSHTLNAVKILAAAGIPLVSETASSDLLTKISPYFFRVAPSNNQQGIIGARYVENILHARHVALFVDPVDPYSSSLANDFKQQFLADGKGDSIVATEQYTVGAQGRGRLPTLLQDALTHTPDLIYFSGYANDVSVLLANLPTSGAFATLQVMGGDALYELGGYPSTARAGFDRLHFTAFAYPDEWDIAGLTAKKPSFFADYINAFNPNNQHPLGMYGYTRTDNDVMLSYDAMLALLTGAKLALAGGKTSITLSELQQGLIRISGAQALQGVSGRIAFGPDGNPVNKALVVLFVIAGGFIKEESLQGCFQVGVCS